MNPGEPWVQPCSQEEMLRDFEGWGDELIALLKVSARFCCTTPNAREHIKLK